MFEKESLQGVGVGRPYGAAAAALETLVAAKRLLGGSRRGAAPATTSGR
jgi:hypothetical protein